MKINDKNGAEHLSANGLGPSPQVSVPSVPKLSDQPWTTEVNNETSEDAGARNRWRIGVERWISALWADQRRPGAVGLTGTRQINGLARVLTLEEPALVGSSDKIPANRLWVMVAEDERRAFAGAQCSLADRSELLHWLGRFAARSNWRTGGRGAAPMTVSAVGVLINHWVAIGWQGREVPEWCQDQVGRARQVFPEVHEDDLYRPWSEVRVDMHTFLSAWGNERAALGRSRPRRSGARKENCKAAEGTIQVLLLVRALEAAHPGSVDPEDIAIIKALGDIINTPTTTPKMAAVIRSAEDRWHLEQGLSSLPDALDRSDHRPRQRTL